MPQHPTVTPTLAIYIHWPFCKKKCPYCDFNSHVQRQIDEEQWCQAYIDEIRYYQERLGPRTVTSIFFGGGTPSLMPASTTESLLTEIARKWSVSDDCEITLESNPTSVEAQKCHDFYHAGINRFSLGVQSLNDEALQFLGREHNAGEALAALETIRQITDHFSFDLIYALPDQSLSAWQSELNRALGYATHHMSLYQLTIEKGTPFYRQFSDGTYQELDADIAASMYEHTNHHMLEHGFNAYEVSNYAKPEFESRHNLTYWRYQPYIGIGPGAHGRMLDENNQLQATMNHHMPETWLKQVNSKQHGLQTIEPLDAQTQMEEKLLMGLRLSEGISLEKIQHIIDPSKHALLIKEGLLRCENHRLYATPKGRLVLNSVIAKLIE